MVAAKFAVTASRPVGSVGWYWYGNDTLILRPEKFWPAYTTVTLSATPDRTALTGTNLVWAGAAAQTFQIGRSQVIKVNANTHRAVVVRDGQAIRNMGVSLGMPGWETRSGVKVLADGYRVRVMTGASIGAGDYTLKVPYAIRLTDSGEFMHAAPWARARIGRVNGSHGCTNLNVADARWVFKNYLMGDPVLTTGTDRAMEAWNGGGGPWNLPWSNWTRDSHPS
jgi:lipoprotein-anchoring transpeptidase ErfK/SrfK